MAVDATVLRWQNGGERGEAKRKKTSSANHVNLWAWYPESKAMLPTDSWSG